MSFRRSLFISMAVIFFFASSSQIISQNNSQKAELTKQRGILTPSSEILLIDSFTDGDLTTDPAWNGDRTAFQIVTDSDVSTGATGSYTLRLNAPASSQTEYLSTQVTSMASTDGHSWSFWIGRRSLAYSSTNNVRIWLWANESNLESGTVDGYAVLIGDNTTNDEIRLSKITNGTPTHLIESSTALTNDLTDIGILIRVTRTNDGVWNLYSSAVPSTSGSGAVAGDLPSAANTPNNLGSVTDLTYSITDGGYVGVAITHTTSASAISTFEFDQFYFDRSSDSQLPVELITFNASIYGRAVDLRWETATEVNNYGFEVLRSYSPSGEIPLPSEYWEKIAFMPGHGNSNSPQYYLFKDKNPPAVNLIYRLKQIDTDGNFEYSGNVLVDMSELEPLPGKYHLAQNYPNPFNPATHIKFSLPENSFVQIIVYNVLGEIAATPLNQTMPAGSHEISFDGSALESGVYVYELRAGSFTSAKKMLLIK